MHIKLWLVLILAGAAWGQPSNGYFFIAPGGFSCCGGTEGTVHVGGGGEYVFGKGIGAGAEAGALAAFQAFQASAIGIVSANGYYHFRHERDLRLDPFVTGGYSIGFRDDHINMGNYGGGVNFWFLSHLGFRAEFRDHVNTNIDETLHYWGFRFGLVFH
jgi:hypothetical protein